MQQKIVSCQIRQLQQTLQDLESSSTSCEDWCNEKAQFKENQKVLVGVTLGGFIQSTGVWLLLQQTLAKALTSYKTNLNVTEDAIEVERFVLPFHISRIQAISSVHELYYMTN